jgi:hypothetical protein
MTKLLSNLSRAKRKKAGRGEQQKCIFNFLTHKGQEITNIITLTTECLKMCYTNLSSMKLRRIAMMMMMMMMMMIIYNIVHHAKSRVHYTLFSYYLNMTLTTQYIQNESLQSIKVDFMDLPVNPYQLSTSYLDWCY